MAMAAIRATSMAAEPAPLPPRRGVPVLATIVVLAAVVAMIALGVWQIGRAHQRDDARAAQTARMDMAPIAFPHDDPAPAEYVYRQVSARCAKVTAWQTVAGKGIDGRSGWAQVAQCEAPGGAPFKVNVGISARPDVPADWSGGAVAGVAVREPDTRTLVGKILRADGERRLMVVAHEPAANLVAARPPSPRDEDNTSWGYAFQWFFFAATALVIYAIALRRRMRG